MKKLTEEQTNFIQTTNDNPQTNQILNAVAGCGKTYTLANMTNNCKPNSIALAFTKASASDLETKIMGAKVSTTYSYLFRIYKQQCGFKFVKVNQYKYWNYLRTHCKGMTKSQLFLAMDAIDSCRNSGLTNPAQFVSPEIEKFSKGISIAFQEGIQDLTTIDFLDMMYLPIIMGMTNSERIGDCFVDECQDLSPIQHQALQLIDAKRYVFVGDPYQAIYGFSGASESSFYDLMTMYNCTESRLTECFRVPNNILEEARRIVPHIHSKLPDGILSYNNSIPSGNHTVLYRTNSELIGTYLSMQGKANIRTSYSPYKFLAQLEKTEIPAKLMREAFNAIPETFDSEAKTVGNLFMKHAEENEVAFTSYDDFGQYIKELTTEDKRDSYPLTLSTIHRAKGLEWDSVTLKHKLEMKNLDSENQEMNLHYVGLTRAKQLLNIVR